MQNFLFVNRGPGPNGRWNWDEIALQAGVGFSDSGRPRSGMGVDAADFDGDGWQDLFVANVDHEMFSVYHNNHDETFRDVAQAQGVARATRLLSGWGLKYFDYDNDGAVDLFLANGHPDDMIDNYSHAGEIQRAASVVSSGRRSQTYMTSASRLARHFRSISPRAAWPSATIDNDGALDVLIGNNGGGSAAAEE